MASAYERLRAPFSECEVIEFTNTSGGTLVGGTWHEEADFRGIVLEDVVDDGAGILIVAVPAPGIEVPKTAPLVIGIHLDLYYDDTADEVNLTVTGNTHIGRSLAAAASADTHVLCSFNNTSQNTALA